MGEFYRQQSEECDRQIERYLGMLPDRTEGKPRLEPKPRHPKRGANEPASDARGLVYRACGVDLTAIEGIDQTTALVLIAESGPDLSRFPSSRHFCAWLGLCPQHKLSGGKVQSRRVRPGINRAAKALRLAAWALPNSKSARGAYCRKMKARLGAAKGIVATAHKLARLVYAMLTRGQEYVGQAMEEYEQAYRVRKLKGLARQARSWAIAWSRPRRETSVGGRRPAAGPRSWTMVKARSRGGGECPPV